LTMTLAAKANFNAATPAPASGKQNVVFADDAGAPTVNVSATDPVMIGDTGSGGSAGNVPAPGAGSAAAGKFLKADATFAVPPGTGITALTGDVTASGVGSVAATAVKIPPGVTLTGTPSIGQVPTATGSAAATWQTPSAAFVNPMTTEGDLIYGGASGAPTRLPAGTSGDVLQTNGSGSAPTWVAPATGGSGQTTVSGSTSGTAVFSQPEGGAYYKKVIIRLVALVGTASYTFPVTFSFAPDFLPMVGASGASVTALSDTAVTITGTGQTGAINLEGY
jgi:hypothetical protein